MCGVKKRFFDEVGKIEKKSHDELEAFHYPGSLDLSLEMLDVANDSLNSLRKYSCGESFAEKSFSTLRQMFDFFGDSKNHHGLVFRGQANAEWELNSSLVRLYKKYGFYCEDGSGDVNSDDYKEVDELFSLIPNSMKTPSPEQKLLFAQHYGFPTRLLDWTESLDIALFFAFERIPEESKTVALFPVDLGKVYLSDYIYDVHYPSVDDGWTVDDRWTPIELLVQLKERKISPDQVLLWLLKKKFPFKPNSWDFMRPKSFWDLRMSVQQTVVSVQDIPVPFEQSFGKASLALPCTCLKATLPVSLRSEVMDYLKTKGVSRDSLFPNVDTLCKEACEGLKLEMKRVIPNFQK